ncbi:MAG: hypothetical protein KAJ19_20365 [Gammaproteobacteria bacterium]|nr:hypothetical protein [Gammaproteobacteria bacterium]
MKTKRISLVALVALFGLLFQALIPLAQTIPHTNSGENLAGRLVICTAFGTKTIDVATGAEVPGDAPSPEAPVESGECLICLISAIADSALINTCETQYLQFAGLSVTFPLSPQGIAHIRREVDTNGARAPPSA